MNPSLDVLRRPGLDHAARVLELHPFEVVRLLALAGELPADLRVDDALVAHIAELGGLQVWWEGAPEVPEGRSRAQALAMELARRMLSRGMVEPASTRADNLFRGLDGESQHILRRWVNLLIREGYLVTYMATSGLVVSVRASAVGGLGAFAADGSGPLASLAAGS